MRQMAKVADCHGADRAVKMVAALAVGVNSLVALSSSFYVSSIAARQTGWMDAAKSGIDEEVSNAPPLPSPCSLWAIGSSGGLGAMLVLAQLKLGKEEL